MEDGLLAMGGDLCTERLLLAYRSGIFPWYDGDVPLWWSPDPRCVIFPREVKISNSMRQVLRKNNFEFRVDADFKEVMLNCQRAKRKGDPGTWISEAIIEAYCALFEMGVAHCAAAYQDGKMVGGLYGLMINHVFCGESMFSHVNNASKFVFIRYARHLADHGVDLIDCQVHNPHLESLGARMIPRKVFLDYLSKI